MDVMLDQAADLTLASRRSSRPRTSVPSSQRKKDSLIHEDTMDRKTSREILDEANFAM